MYTRKPDFFDGETAPAMVHWMYDSSTARTVPMVLYRYGSKNHAIDSRYVFRNWREGKRLHVIFEKDEPSRAAPYVLWGYWIRWEEIIGSVIILLVLFQVAVQITSNPSPEALIEQLDHKEEKKRKYLD